MRKFFLLRTSSLEQQQIGGRRTATLTQMSIRFMWNEFHARFCTHYVPRGTIKLKKEFTDLKQGSMSMNEYLNSFIQLSRYSPDDINTDEKKQDMFLNGLNDNVQFQFLNTDYANF
jgi:hypothetical protein